MMLNTLEHLDTVLVHYQVFLNDLKDAPKAVTACCISFECINNAQFKINAEKHKNVSKNGGNNILILLHAVIIIDLKLPPRTSTKELNYSIHLSIWLLHFTALYLILHFSSPETISRMRLLHSLDSPRPSNFLKGIKKKNTSYYV